MNATWAADPPEATVRAALAANATTRSLALADAALEPVRGGLSNHAWKAEKDGRRWFVRLGGPELVSLGVDRASEQALLGIADASGLAPPLLACDPSNGLLVTQFIAGGPWRREDAREARNIERLAERLRVLHGLAAPAGIRRVDFAAQARSLEAQLRRLGGTRGRDPAADDAGRAVEAAIESGAAIRRLADAANGHLSSRRPRRVPCHNDLHHLNLLDDGRRLWLVDWEYGGLGDPVFDLASFACQHEFDATLRAVLLDAYGARNAIEPATFEAACRAFDCVQCLWYLLWAARHPDADGEYASRAGALVRRLTAPGA